MEPLHRWCLAQSDPTSVDAFFAAAQQARNLRMIAGKVIDGPYMHQTTFLTLQKVVMKTAKPLSSRWHGKDRLAYAVTPRFAPTSTPEQLQVAGRLLEGT